MYNSSNFYMGTTADFAEAAAPDREADYVSDSGSAYWYARDGVYRASNHWGYGVASCDWFLGDLDEGVWDEREDVRCGFCPWDGFEAKDYSVAVYNVAEEIADGFDAKGRPFASVPVTDANAADGYVEVFGHRVRFRYGWFMFVEL